MNIRYYIDPETGFPHIHKHNVFENEVKDVLLNPGEDRLGREGSPIAMGQTYIRVIYVPGPEPKSVFVITAFDLSGKPLTAYKRRRRKKK